MNTRKSVPQIRKGDPLAQMNHSKNQTLVSDQNSIGYKLNIRLRTLRTAKGGHKLNLVKYLLMQWGCLKKFLPQQ